MKNNIKLDKNKFPILSKCISMNKEEVEKYKNSLSEEELVQAEKESKKIINSITTLFNKVIEVYDE